MSEVKLVINESSTGSKEAYIEKDGLRKKSVKGSNERYYYACEETEFKHGYASVTVGVMSADDDVCHYFYIERKKTVIDEQGRVVADINDVASNGKIINLHILAKEVVKNGVGIVHYADENLLLDHEKEAIVKDALKNHLSQQKQEGKTTSELQAIVSEYQACVDNVKEEILGGGKQLDLGLKF